MLGSPRMPYAKWARAASLYTWPLWRNCMRPKPIPFETGAEVHARQIGGKPEMGGGDQYGPRIPYTWKLWHHYQRPHGGLGQLSASI